MIPSTFSRSIKVTMGGIALLGVMLFFCLKILPMNDRARAWPEVRYGSVTLNYPPNLMAVQRDNVIVFSSISENDPPALFSITKIGLIKNLAQLPPREALLAVAKQSLEPGDIVSTTYHDGGLEVIAQTFTRHHFFVYNPATNRALEFLASDDSFFASSDFLEILKTLKF